MAMAKLIELIENASEKSLQLWFADLSNLHREAFEAAGLLPIIQKILTSKEAKQLLEAP